MTSCWIYDQHSIKDSNNNNNNSATDNKVSKLRLLLWNARSLNKQINAFQSYIYSENFDIIAITETWLSNHTYTNEILPSGYAVTRKDRDGKGGCVMLAIKHTINISQLPSPNELELISVETDSNLIVSLIYHPPNSSDQYNL